MNLTIVELTIHGLSLMPESIEDAPEIYKYMGCDPEITRYTGWNPYSSLQATIDKIGHDLKADDGSSSWVIKKDGTFVGTIGAYDYRPEDGSIEIGYSIARPFWGNGYAGAAVKAMVGLLQAQPQIRSVRAWSHPDNIASLRVLRSAGMKAVRTEGEQVIFEKRFDE